MTEERAPISGTPHELILASASPRRSELMRGMGLRFRTHPAHVEEVTDAGGGPAAMVARNAGLKADAVAGLFPEALVLGADTTVVLDGAVLGKPKDMEAAREGLRHLSGREHSVFTGVALRWSEGGYTETFVERSRVYFRELDEAAISAYYETTWPLDKAGGYGIQENAELLVAKLEGSRENVMGLPVASVRGRLAEGRFDFSINNG